MRRTARLVFFLLLGAVSLHFLAQSSEGDVPSSEAARRTAPNLFFGSFVYGAIRPLYREYLWASVDSLHAEGRYWEAIAMFDRLAADPASPPAVWSLEAHILIYDLALREVDPQQRWRFLRHGLERLRDGIARFPSDFRLRESLVLALMHQVSTDSNFDSAFRRWIGHDALQEALVVAHDMRARFSDSTIAHLYYLRAGEEATLRLLYSREFASASRTLEEQARVLDELPAASLDANVVRRAAFLRQLSDFVSAFAKCITVETTGEITTTDPPGLERVLERFRGWTEDPIAFDLDADGAGHDARFIACIHLLIMHLCQSDAAAKKPALILPTLAWLRTIAAFGETRIGHGKPYYSSAYVDRFADFLDLDRRLCELAARGAGPPADLVRQWSDALDVLERLLEERVGHARPDSFRSRLIRHRPWVEGH